MALWVSRILFYHIIYVLLELNALLQRSFCYTLVPFILLFINVSLVQFWMHFMKYGSFCLNFELFMYAKIFEYLFHIFQLWLLVIRSFVVLFQL